MKNNFLKAALYFSFAGCLVMGFACEGADLEHSSEPIPGRPLDMLEAIVSEADEVAYDATYQGVLPCKDCGGIKTTLQLSGKQNMFSLKEEFLNTELAPHILNGHFYTERGFENDKDATLYILNDDRSAGEQLYFVRETGKDSLLVKLDSEKHKTNHSNFFLKKMAHTPD